MAVQELARLYVLQMEPKFLEVVLAMVGLTVVVRRDLLQVLSHFQLHTTG